MQLGRTALLALACASVCVCAGFARDDARVASVAVAGTRSLSIGLPWDGRLEYGVQLSETAFLRPVAGCAKRGNFYGTSELVTLLERSARVIAARWPGSQLAVGELSAARGGKLAGHHSHRSGRDVDVAFFMRDAAGQSSLFQRFVSFGLDGLARRAPRRLYFDDVRNWALVASLLRDPDARVQYIFVAQPLRTRLLMEGRRRGENDGFLRIAAAVLVEPKEGQNHDSHFHVRVYCARDDRPACQDTDPYWSWYDGVPPEGKFAELPTIRWKAPTDSASTARLLDHPTLL